MKRAPKNFFTEMLATGIEEDREKENKMQS
jgi:hypothetical protein